MGHHLTAQIFGAAADETHFLSLTGYREHLSDPVELAADTLVSLGIYPADVTKSLFDTPEEAGPLRLEDAVFERVLEYIKNRYGLSFDLDLEPEKKFQALAALVHYTKLRRALLEEYGI